METTKWTIAEIDIKMSDAVKNIQDLKTAIEGANAAKKASEGNPLSKEYIESSAQLKLLNQDLRTQEKILQQTITVQNEEVGTLKRVNTESALLRAEREKLKTTDEDYEKELLRINAALNENSKFVIENSDAQKQQILNVGNYEGEQKSLRLQLRETTQQMQQMMVAGKENSIEFQELSAKAGKLKDSMNAVNDQIKTMATGNKFERVANFGKGAFDAVAGSAQIAEGSMALFGSENEKVVKSIQKMMALQSLSNGVNQVYNSLIKEGALVQGLIAVKTWISTTAIAAYNLVVGTSTGLMKAFKIALATTGIGLLVVGIMAAVQAMGMLNEETENSIESQNELNNVIEKSNRGRVAKIQSLEKEIELMKAQGKPLDEIFKKEKELIDVKLFNSRVAIASGLKDKQLADEKLIRDGLIADKEILIAKEKKRLSDIQDANEENLSLKQQQRREKNRIEEEKQNKEIEDNLIKLAEKQSSHLNYELELWKLSNESKLKGVKELNQQIIDDEILRQKTILDKEIAMASLRNQANLMSYEEYNLLVETKTKELNDNKLKLQDDYLIQEQQKKVDAAQMNYESDLAIAEGSIQAMTDLKIKGLEEQRLKEIAIANKTGADVGKINAKFAKAEKDLTRATQMAKLDLVAGFARNISTIVGEQTKLGKAAAAAATTIETIKSGVSAYAGMVAAIPGPVGIGLGAVAAAASLASGFAAVKKIYAVPENGGAASSSSSDISYSSAATNTATTSTDATALANSSSGIENGIISRNTESLRQNNIAVLVVDDVTRAQNDNNLKVNLGTI